MAETILTARALPRLFGALVTLPDGRTVPASNQIGSRLPPNSEVEVRQVGRRWYVTGRTR